MRSLVKKILPSKVLKSIKKKRRNFILNESYNFDKKRYKEYAYNLRKEFTKDNLRSKITFHYHAIEKGLSNANLRLGFGKSAFDELFFSMDKYLELGFPTEDDRFQSAISVLQSYVELHDKNNFRVTEIEEKYSTYEPHFIKKNKNIGGFTIFNKKELPDFEILSFEELSSQRYSVRDFGETKIEESKVFQAIQIATKTPSVCNRQAWKVYFIKDESMVVNTLKLQGGLSGNGNNLKNLLLVTCDKQFMNGPHERNQTYIDGGLFTMSLLYALASKSIASCTLNTNFTISKEKDVRELLSISMSEDLIAFIAIGSYPEVIKVAKSPRDNAHIITTIIG